MPVIKQFTGVIKPLFHLQTLFAPCLFMSEVYEVEAMAAGRISREKALNTVLSTHRVSFIS